MNLIIAVTGASGSIYAKLLIEELLASDEVNKIAIIRSRNALMVWEHELGEAWVESPRLEYIDNNNFFSSVASGSAKWERMVVIPASMGCLGRLASGVSDDLISRAADVMLKENKDLLLCPRETPFNLIHIENILRLKRAGAQILPCSPSFYSKPKSVNELVMTVVQRILDHLGIPGKEAYRWGGKTE